MLQQHDVACLCFEAVLGLLVTGLLTLGSIVSMLAPMHTCRIYNNTCCCCSCCHRWPV
jgi:hypothetical protein